MPYPRDASSWRRLNLATPTPGDASSGQHVDFLPWAPLRGPTICWLWLWSTPRDGTVHKPPSLDLTLVSAKRLRPHPIIHVAFLLMWHSMCWWCDALGCSLISRHVARSCGWGWVPLVLLQVNVISFQKRALKALFHSLFHIPTTVHLLLQKLFLHSLFAPPIFANPITQRYGFSSLMTLSLYCIVVIIAWACLFFLHLSSSSSLLRFPCSSLLAWVGFF